MNDSDKQRFAEIMYGLADNFRDSINKAGLRMRFMVLREYSISQVETAAVAIMRDRQFTKFPTTGEIIRCIEKPLHVDTEARAALAWNQVYSRVKSGEWRQGDIGSPMIDNTVRLMGGWNRLGAMREDEVPFREREFKEKFGHVNDSPQITTSDAREMLDIIDGKRRQVENKPRLIGGAQQ